MVKTSTPHETADTQPITRWRVWLRRLYLLLPKNKWLRRTLIALAVFVTATLCTMYGIALWYQHSQKDKPVSLGATFIPAYAEHLGLDAEETFAAMLNDLGVRQLRLVSYWSELEPTKGQYNFERLDWQFAMAEERGAKISLALGLRQPRWPECHMPDWAKNEPASVWHPQLNNFIAAVVERYKTSPSLASYQLENEFFNRFGDCHDFDRARLEKEFALVQKLDPAHPVILSRSNNYAGFALGKPQADIVGISLYRRVWDSQLTKRYAQYPFPSWHYAFLAGTQKILTDRDSIIHELQTEPWPPHGQSIRDTSLAEQNKSFDAKRFETTVDFAIQTGIRHIDLWGAEYWYYRMVTLEDPSVWNEAKNVFETPHD
jgi:beta-galactosidase GanA